jgi:hypothetical protein
MYIYVIGTQQRQKIGFSSDVGRRLSMLQTGNSEKLTIHHTIEVPDDQARYVERTIHQQYNYLRVKGEWFNMTVEQAKLAIDHAAIRWVT